MQIVAVESKQGLHMQFDVDFLCWSMCKYNYMYYKMLSLFRSTHHWWQEKTSPCCVLFVTVIPVKVSSVTMTCIILGWEISCNTCWFFILFSETTFQNLGAYFHTNYRLKGICQSPIFPFSYVSKNSDKCFISEYPHPQLQCNICTTHLDQVPDFSYGANIAPFKLILFLHTMLRKHTFLNLLLWQKMFWHLNYPIPDKHTIYYNYHTLSSVIQ